LLLHNFVSNTNGVENQNENPTPKSPPKKEYKYDELRVRSLPPGQRKQLDNIASHLGITTNKVLRSNLHKIINSFPEHMRTTTKPKD